MTFLCLDSNRFPMPTNPSSGSQTAKHRAVPECELTLTPALGPVVVTITVTGVAGVAEAGLTEHWGASTGFGDTEHANVTVSVNPLTAISSRVDDADEPGDRVAGVSAKADRAKSGDVVSLNTVPKPLAPNKVVPYKLPFASCTRSSDTSALAPVNVNRSDSLPVESSLKIVPPARP